MSRFRIVCTEQDPAEADHDHAAIKAVGTGSSANEADQRWTLTQVVAAIDAGDTFYTKGERSGAVAEVETVHCSRCGSTRFRSKADATTDNNLDSLRRCNWS